MSACDAVADAASFMLMFFFAAAGALLGERCVHARASELPGCRPLTISGLCEEQSAPALCSTLSVGFQTAAACGLVGVLMFTYVLERQLCQVRVT